MENLLTSSQREIYLNIRAEQIKERQDRENGHNFKQPYSLEKAREVAECQLDEDIVFGKLRVSLDDLLLKSNEECRFKIVDGLTERAKNVPSLWDNTKVIRLHKKL